MLNILITVGTTKFDELIEFADNLSEIYEHKFIAQISNGEYRPKNMEHFEFSDNINEFYEWADIVICHAGAGTIYTLLEMNKKVIVVPNQIRVDKHQNDIATAMSNKGFVKSISDLSEINLKSCLDDIDLLSFEEYQKDDFFIEKELTNYIFS